MTNYAGRYDFHTHTLHSDGTESAKELFEMAIERELSGLAVTDHETVEAYSDIWKNNAYGFKGEIFSGVELRTSSLKTVIELLGYGINIDEMRELLKGRYPTKAEENSYILQSAYEVFTKHGIKLPANFVNNRPNDMWPSRYIAHALVQNESNRHIIGEELFLNPGFIWRKYITNPQSDFYCDITSMFPTINEVISMIHRAGGKAGLAHFGQYTNYEQILCNVLENNRLDFIEVLYPFSTSCDEKIVFGKKIALEHSLPISGGSDFHGTAKKNELAMMPIQDVDVKEFLSILTNLNF